MVGTAKPTPSLAPELVSICWLIPTTLPSLSSSGPPELPGLIEASVWIAPEGGWGQGSVVLIEIPVDTEFNDNIVSFWQPGQPLAAGVRHDFAYRMGVGMAPAPRTPIAQVVQTRSGLAVNGRATRSFLIDYDLAPFVDQPDPVASVTASDGTIDHAYVMRLPEAGVMRLAFEFRPERAELAELTARLDSGNVRMSETWLYRWTKE